MLFLVLQDRVTDACRGPYISTVVAHHGTRAYAVLICVSLTTSTCQMHRLEHMFNTWKYGTPRTAALLCRFDTRHMPEALDPPEAIPAINRSARFRMDLGFLTDIYRVVV